jgi:hypothetical protein
VIARDGGHVAGVRSGFTCDGRVEPPFGDQPALLGAALADVLLSVHRSIRGIHVTIT